MMGKIIVQQATSTPTPVASSPVPPVLNVSPSLQSVQLGQPVVFVYLAVAKTAGAQLVAMLILFGDGMSAPLQAQAGTISHIYSSPGRYTVVVYARDSAGAIGTSVAQISVVGPTPTPTPSPTPSPSAAQFGQGMANSQTAPSDSQSTPVPVATASLSDTDGPTN